ncbi:hypothetical protein MFRU_005g01730 [Monilinia fructicola]|nr:hypothetical protein MFRU_005g01730 [Monilinia fructicola]
MLYKYLDPSVDELSTQIFDKPFRKSYFFDNLPHQEVIYMTYILDIEQKLRGSTFSMHDDQKSLNYNLKIINYNLNPDENASRQQVASQASLQQQGSINTIPSEIIQLIMGQLPPCMRACLGVTCKRMYQNFKSTNPGIISLLTIAGRTWKAKLSPSFSPPGWGLDIGLGGWSHITICFDPCTGMKRVV